MLEWIKLENLNLPLLATMFKQSEPFNHIVIDNFFNEELLDLVCKEFHNSNFDAWDKRNDENTQVKWRSNWSCDNDIPPVTMDLIQFLNSGDFLKFLSNLSGITGIIPDPYLTGGGYNQINRGGMLAIHADGNWHDLMGVHRRLNVILYLNKNWNERWGGDLELWSKTSNNQPLECVKKISPIYNRLCIFRTDDFSFHGHPTPLDCPDEISRRSLILYYYTNTRPPEEVLSLDNKHRAMFYKVEK